MEKTSDLKDAINQKTITQVFLGLASFGVYSLMWMYKYTPIIEKITKREISNEGFLISIAVAYGLGGFMADTQAYGKAAILSVACLVASVVWAFNAKKALENYSLEVHKIDLKLNPIYTALFTLFYINYCINDLPEAERKKIILNS
ncbi:DUF4234 domain-containing protein [Pseudomonas sp. MAP12]|uniref:DUF4234 domain-containing protein n=1 Tax=Geopseudomonas aromaticivorans TaxID=2849492 RepID=A0ABS6MSS3_9GAMM|nr:DUF4234 domain-containing protein [Pseudomonas aromaticivorans]MBV2131859.1 DUF4234 domain-containing protein [Pseudomonas aromaticivorans]